MVTADDAVRRPAEGVDREAICRFLEQVPIDHASLQFCERFDEQSRIWNFDMHSHPYFELIFFIEGKANIDAGAETVDVAGFDVVVYPPGLLHAEHLELGRASGDHLLLGGHGPYSRIRARDQAHG